MLETQKAGVARTSWRQKVRYKAAFALFVALVLLPAAAQQETSLSVPCGRRGNLKIRTAPKSISAPRPDLAVIEGRWASEGGAQNFLPAINTVWIACDKSKKICRETIASLEIEGGEGRPGEAEGRLGIRVEEYRIQKWSNTGFSATGRTRAGEVELRVSLENKKATRTVSGARGARWVLE
jgi:hypothetical protein